MLMKTTFFHKHFSASLQFVAGALIIPTLLFQQFLPFLVAQALIAASAASIAGKRIKWLYFVIMVTTITVFNLLTPIGRVIAQVGPWSITVGALRTGLLKGFAIVGLVFVSLASVRPDLRIPGRLGGLIGGVFYYFERILEGKKRLKASRLIAGIDQLLSEVYLPGTTTEAREDAAVPTTATGFVVAGVLVVVHWSLLIAGFFVDLAFLA